MVIIISIPGIGVGNTMPYIIGIWLFSVMFDVLLLAAFESFTGGKTPGKYITGTRAINDDGTRISFKTALLRSLSRIVPFEVFSTKPYDRLFFDKYNEGHGFGIEYFETHLGPHIVNAVERVEAVCVFVNDKLTKEVIGILASKGVKIIALRCAGFNNVDLGAAKALGLRVCRAPAYSPEAVAEYSVAMLLTLNRKTHKAYNRVRDQNFSLNGLLGMNIHGKTVGVIGTGKIGKAFCKIMMGFGARVIAR